MFPWNERIRIHSHHHKGRSYAHRDRQSERRDEESSGYPAEGGRISLPRRERFDRPGSLVTFGLFQPARACS